MGDMLVIDGSHGEGGGQILRSALSLAAIMGRPVRVERIRAGRPRPGLAAQHVTAARAVAAVCGGVLEGDELESQTLTLTPDGALHAGDYLFDVAAAREGGSAGAVTLVLQTVLLPLALADGTSTIELHGGTHMAWSPSFHYARDTWLPVLARMGVTADIELIRWGWYPVGGGAIRARIEGRAGPSLTPLTLVDRGSLQGVRGLAIAANLPAHIAQRMTDRALALLAAAGMSAEIRPRRVRAPCAGAGIFLTATYEHGVAGFTGLGKRGKASETVAEEAVAALLAHRDSGAAVDTHLADQLILPAALADGETVYTVERVNRHLETSAWLIERFGIARVRIEPMPKGTARVVVSGRQAP
jgi:RNA 3'-terminal phosphate cyclase (ATP)